MKIFSMLNDQLTMAAPLSIVHCSLVKFLTAMRGKCVLFLMGLVFLGLTGCHTTQPVSSTSTVKEMKKDSSATNTEKKDSSTYRETITEKTLKEEIKKERETFSQKLSAFMDKLFWIGIISIVLTAVFLVLNFWGKIKNLTA